MAKFQSPLLGYNNNVRHKNRVFHIQTEDSGVNHPHIITHLFMDGGRILKSVKKSYAEHVGTDGMKEIVRGLMKEQHKAIFIALRDGQFDHLVDGGPAPAAGPGAAATAAAASASAAASAAVSAAASAEAAEVTAALAASGPPTKPEPSRSEAELPPVTIDDAKRPGSVAPPPSRRTGSVAPPPSRRTGSVAPPESKPQLKGPTVEDVPPPPSSSAIASSEAAARALPTAPTVLATPARSDVPLVVLPASEPDDVPVTTRQPPEARPDAAEADARKSGRELTLDFDALQASAQDAVSASLFHSADLPPPPKNLFAAKEPGTGGKYRTADAREEREEPAAPPPGQPRRDAREEPDSMRAGPVSRPLPVHASAPAKSPPPASVRPPPGPRLGGNLGSNRAPPPSRPGEARYAPARPASIFGSTQRPPPASIFSDELVSDKSLDEVILSYLAEDLEPPRRK